MATFSGGDQVVRVQKYQVFSATFFTTLFTVPAGEYAEFFILNLTTNSTYKITGAGFTDDNSTLSTLHTSLAPSVGIKIIAGESLQVDYSGGGGSADMSVFVKFYKLP